MDGCLSLLACRSRRCVIKWGRYLPACPSACFSVVLVLVDHDDYDDYDDDVHRPHHGHHHHHQHPRLSRTCPGSSPIRGTIMLPYLHTQSLEGGGDLASAHSALASFCIRPTLRQAKLAVLFFFSFLSVCSLLSLCLCVLRSPNPAPLPLSLSRTRARYTVSGLAVRVVPSRRSTKTSRSRCPPPPCPSLPIRTRHLRPSQPTSCPLLAEP